MNGAASGSAEGIIIGASPPPIIGPMHEHGDDLVVKHLTSIRTCPVTRILQENGRSPLLGWSESTHMKPSCIAALYAARRKRTIPEVFLWPEKRSSLWYQNLEKSGSNHSNG